MAEQQAGSHVAGNEREVCAVVPIEYGFRTGSTDDSHERVVVVGMTTVEPVGRAVNVVFPDDIREIQVGEAHRDAEVQHCIYASPVAKADGNAVGIALVEAIDVGSV